MGAASPSGSCRVSGWPPPLTGAFCSEVAHPWLEPHALGPTVPPLPGSAALHTWRCSRISYTLETRDGGIRGKRCPGSSPHSGISPCQGSSGARGDGSAPLCLSTHGVRCGCRKLSAEAFKLSLKCLCFKNIQLSGQLVQSRAI